VPLGMANNVHFGCFPFLSIKSSFSIFEVSKIGFFVKQLPNIGCQIGPQEHYKIIYHILLKYQQLFECPSFSMYHL
jgi:hypothetical protein